MHTCGLADCTVISQSSIACNWNLLRDQDQNNVVRSAVPAGIPLVTYRASRTLWCLSVVIVSVWGPRCRLRNWDCHGAF